MPRGDYADERNKGEITDYYQVIEPGERPHRAQDLEFVDLGRGLGGWIADQECAHAQRAKPIARRLTLRPMAEADEWAPRVGHGLVNQGRERPVLSARMHDAVFLAAGEHYAGLALREGDGADRWIRDIRGTCPAGSKRSLRAAAAGRAMSRNSPSAPRFHRILRRRKCRPCHIARPRRRMHARAPATASRGSMRRPGVPRSSDQRLFSSTSDGLAEIPPAT